MLQRDGMRRLIHGHISGILVVKCVLDFSGRVLPPHSCCCAAAEHACNTVWGLGSTKTLSSVHTSAPHNPNASVNICCLYPHTYMYYNYFKSLRNNVLVVLIFHFDKYPRSLDQWFIVMAVEIKCHWMPMHAILRCSR